MKNDSTYEDSDSESDLEDPGYIDSDSDADNRDMEFSKARQFINLHTKLIDRNIDLQKITKFVTQFLIPLEEMHIIHDKVVMNELIINHLFSIDWFETTHRELDDMHITSLPKHTKERLLRAIKKHRRFRNDDGTNVIPIIIKRLESNNPNSKKATIKNLDADDFLAEIKYIIRENKDTLIKKHKKLMENHETLSKQEKISLSMTITGPYLSISKL